MCNFLSSKTVMTTSNSQSQGEYYMYKMENEDYIWLCDSEMANLNAKYQETICEMNNTFDLETSTIEPNGLKDTQSFKESLFLMYKFLNFDLWGTPNNESISNHYLHACIHVLKEMCCRGIYPLYGCEPNKNERSHFDFIVLIDDRVENEFIDLLKTLFKRGVNVTARKVKNFHVEKELAFISEGNSLIYCEDIAKAAKNDYSIREVTNYSTTISIDFGINGMISDAGRCAYEAHHYQLDEFYSSKTHSIYYIESWSQTFDTFRVEDVLLQLWLQFNSKHGRQNNYHGMSSL